MIRVRTVSTVIRVTRVTQFWLGANTIRRIQREY